MCVLDGGFYVFQQLSVSKMLAYIETFWREIHFLCHSRETLQLYCSWIALAVDSCNTTVFTVDSCKTTVFTVDSCNATALIL